MPRLQALLGALAVWILAMIGAAGVAYWLQLSFQNVILLIVAVAVLSFIGAFVPIVRLFNRTK
ncbi:MAG: hypothetical protein HZB51_32775 [Chloroflexi bacterium]|nr:hypothetical protein [Chloroflexota bacterium]